MLKTVDNEDLEHLRLLVNSQYTCMLHVCYVYYISWLQNLVLEYHNAKSLHQ